MHPFFFSELSLLGGLKDLFPKIWLVEKIKLLLILLLPNEKSHGLLSITYTPTRITQQKKWPVSDDFELSSPIIRNRFRRKLLASIVPRVQPHKKKHGTYLCLRKKKSKNDIPTVFRAQKNPSLYTNSK